ncbi:MAG: ATP-binding protein [Candidatus Binatia bacterium]
MRRLAVQLLLPIVIVVLSFLLVAAFYWSREFERLYVDSLTARLEREVHLLADSLPWGLRGAELDRLCRESARELGVRVTVIADDGEVLGESDEPSAGLEDHGRRPEIIEARRRDTGKATRFSHTVHEMMLYVATYDRQAEGRRFVRIGMPLTALSQAKRLIQWVLSSGFVVALLIGGGAAWLISRRLAQRVHRIEAYSRQIVSGARGESDRIGEERPDDELDALETRLVGLAREIRGQVAAIEDERAKLEVVLRNMADGVVVLDADGRILLCNASARELLDLPSATELIGARLTFLCRNPDLSQLVDEVLRTGASRLQREIVLAGFEPPRIVLVSAAPLPEEEKPGGAILVFHDITRVRQLEMVRADFVANVSHELRTPLTAIRGYAETLLNGALDDREKAIQFLNVIDRHSRRLARLIDDLLSLSDLELGRVELHRRAISVAPMIESVLEVLGPQAAARQIGLAADVPGELPKLHADRDRIEEVLINLVDNAIKYSGTGTTVTVRAREIRSSEREVELAVVDQGIGIPEKDIPRLTERFYRVDRARSRELGGTGLGLAIVKHIVQAHDGRLRIDSQVNVGTTVTVTLPTGASGE